MSHIHKTRKYLAITMAVLLAIAVPAQAPLLHCNPDPYSPRFKLFQISPYRYAVTPAFRLLLRIMALTCTSAPAETQTLRR